MFSPHVITLIGYASLGLLVFFIFMTIHQLRLYIKGRREDREYAAGEASRDYKADRIAARAVANVSTNGRHRNTAAVAKSTAPVRVVRAKTPTSATPVRNVPARQRVSAKWDPFGDEL